MSIFFAKLSTIIYLTNLIMIPESGITEWWHSNNVHRLPPFFPNPQTTPFSPTGYYSVFCKVFLHKLSCCNSYLSFFLILHTQVRSLSFDCELLTYMYLVVPALPRKLLASLTKELQFNCKIFRGRQKLMF